MKNLIIEGDSVMYKECFNVESGDFAAAGEVSASIKQKLKKIGIDQKIIRRIAIVCYEAELNMIIHSLGGTMSMMLQPEKISITCDDVGPGIPNISMAMTEGYSTAPESVRMMGFGAGMGLPNINKNCDHMGIESSPEGTHILMEFDLK